jgi:hypothetical protein
LKGKEFELYLRESFERVYSILSAIIARKVLTPKNKTSHTPKTQETSNPSTNTTNTINWAHKVEGFGMKKSKHLRNW